MPDDQARHGLVVEVICPILLLDITEKRRVCFKLTRRRNNDARRSAVCRCNVEGFNHGRYWKLGFVWPSGAKGEVESVEETDTLLTSLVLSE